MTPKQRSCSRADRGAKKETKMARYYIQMSLPFAAWGQIFWEEHFRRIIQISLGAEKLHRGGAVGGVS